MDYVALKAKIGAYPSGTTDAAILADLTTVASSSAGTLWFDVPVATVEAYLSLQGVLAAMETWLAANPTPTSQLDIAWLAAKEMLRTVNSPHVMIFATSDGPSGPNAAAIMSMLNALLATPPALITQAQYNVLVGFMRQPAPWASVNGCAGVTENDLITARLTA